jgi:hypothetical protein
MSFHSSESLLCLLGEIKTCYSLCDDDDDDDDDHHYQKHHCSDQRDYDLALK